jgi:hypothetical protein
MIHLRIVAQHLVYSEEPADGDVFKPSATSSLLTILQKCTVSTRQSLAMSDNTSTHEATAFDQLLTVCDEMGTDGQC